MNAPGGAAGRQAPRGDPPAPAASPRIARQPGAKPVTSLAAQVVRWQRRHGRNDLPWQATREPYRVWLSEVMLQQTQVATVLPYYARFLARFPDVATLAAAALDDVLALWSGLGYYRRARLAHRCAQVVVAEHGGCFPRDAAELAALPGIGRSTAAAMAAVCFGQRLAILDGNVKRVLARVLGFDADLARAAHREQLWQLAQALLPRAQQVATYNQGLMDLGATICLPRAPRCERCPLAGRCVARAGGRAQSLPVDSTRVARGRRLNGLLLLTRRDAVYLVRRPEQGVWAGLWSLPEAGSAAAWQAVAALWPGHGEFGAPLLHTLTHFDWQLEPLLWRLPARLPRTALRSVESGLPAGRWFARSQALALGLPAPVRKLLAS